jgi:septal ring factor EnvC (AmiA/AmiB activator)
LNELLDTIKSSEDDAHTLIKGVNGQEENRYLKQAKAVEQEFQVLIDHTSDSNERINEQKQRLANVRKTLDEQNRTVSR